LSRFNGASGIATTPTRLSYVSDLCNNTIRAVTAAGDTSTVAGNRGTVGASDGTGLAARFWGPSGMALDAAGNLFVADYNNALIRKVTPGGAVSTYAGAVPHYGSADGTGAGQVSGIHAESPPMRLATCMSRMAITPSARSRRPAS
jgi:hypothetical protein